MAPASFIGPVYGGKPVASGLGVRALVDMSLGDTWILVRLEPIGLVCWLAWAFTFAALGGGTLSVAWGFGIVMT